jgi:hypothetical protein
MLVVFKLFGLKNTKFKKQVPKKIHNRFQVTGFLVLVF